MTKAKRPAEPHAVAADVEFDDRRAWHQFSAQDVGVNSEVVEAVALYRKRQLKVRPSVADGPYHPVRVAVTPA